jgi:uncharacterized membrane protein YkgB
MVHLSTSPERLLRYSFAIVYCWFGALKLLGYSPAHSLVVATLSWFSDAFAVSALGWFEIALGLGFLVPRITSPVLLLFFVHMAGTFLPFAIRPADVWTGQPAALTLVGQYIVKNIVFLAAGLALRQLWAQSRSVRDSA